MLLGRMVPFLFIFILSALLPGRSLYADSLKASATKEPAFITMPAPGEKVPLGNGQYLIYGFVEKPKMGSVIMKIRVFNNKGEKDGSVSIAADVWMPSMPSMGTAHDTFKLSKKGDYLMPVEITMPGEWEIKITIEKNGKVIYRGSHRFNV